MSILYIEDKIKENKMKKEVIDILESIGLTASDIPDIENDVKKRFDKMLEYHEWVKKSFFQEYELNEHNIISPKFGEEK